MASVSKQFTATSIVLAAEQGHLSLDDDVRKYLPELPDYGRRITLRQMLHQTSGFRDFLDLVFLSGRNAADLASPAEILKLIARQKGLNNVPGAEWVYSNSNYFLLGEVIRHATGKSLKDFAAENIFQHLAIATPYLDLIEEFTLREQLRFHFKLKPCRQGWSEAEVLERMYLTHARDKYISNFSSGMKQRLKLALAFFSQADIVFLDEPGTNLDQQAFDWYQQQLADLPQHCLVFIASNQPSEYPASAQKIDIMRFK